LIKKNEKIYTPLTHLKDSTGKLSVCNSYLSETAVLGFEYGMSIDNPKNLNIFEAQFGDFSLNAQTIIDQFISSGEDKWGIQSSLVLILPHGYDGAGPEHSSCRLERYLQLTNCKIDGPQNDVNMFVCFPSTPSNFFHLLRRQMKLDYRKPLIIAGPKTLLRLSKCVSNLEEFDIDHKFLPILSDNLKPIDDMNTLLICSGKVFYEIDDERTKRSLQNKFGIIRIEEFSPFPFELLEKEFKKYTNVKKVKYVQEEPENQGALLFCKTKIRIYLKKNLDYHLFIPADQH